MTFRPAQWLRCAIIAAASAAAIILTPAAATADQLYVGLRPAKPQPAAGAVKPGLAVRYHYTYVRTIHALMGFAEPRKGELGRPLPMVNYRTGFGNVLTSNRNMGVGAKIYGFIKFDSPGEYRFKVHSNDGVRLYIGGREIFEDPEVHSDEMSDPIRVKINAPGWYPLLIWYFQRKGTATLELFWQAPGGSGYKHVPTASLAHKPEK